MGGGVSLHQLQQLPEHIDRDLFHKLVKDKRFSLDAYEHFVDREDGRVSRERLREIALARDCHLSYEWGIDHRGRSVHKRVQRIAEYLTQTKGLVLYGEEGQYRNNSSLANKAQRERVRESLQHCQCMLVFFTARFFEKFAEQRRLQPVPTLSRTARALAHSLASPAPLSSSLYPSYEERRRAMALQWEERFRRGLRPEQTLSTSVKTLVRKNTTAVGSNLGNSNNNNNNNSNTLTLSSLNNTRSVSMDNNFKTNTNTTNNNNYNNDNNNAQEKETVEVYEANLIQMEFEEFVSLRGNSRYILPVILEPLGRISHAPASLQDLFAHRLCIDFSEGEEERDGEREQDEIEERESDTEEDRRARRESRRDRERLRAREREEDEQAETKKLEELSDYILKVITPLREGGDFVARNRERERSVAGKHRKWLQAALTGDVKEKDASDERIALYVDLLMRAKILSFSKLLSLLQTDDLYLVRLGFEERHAERVFAFVEKEVKHTFDPTATKMIERIFAQKEARARVRESEFREQLAKAREDSERVRETSLMTGEDALSFALRAAYARREKDERFEEMRDRLFKTMQEERDSYHHSVSLLEENTERERVLHVLQSRSKRFQRVVDSDDVEEICELFRLTVQDLDRWMRKEGEREREREREPERETDRDSHNERRVSFLDSSSPSRSLSRSPSHLSPSFDAPRKSHASHDSVASFAAAELTFIFQQSLFLLHKVQSLSLGNTENAALFVQRGVVKLCLSLLKRGVSHKIAFVSPFQNNSSLSHNSYASGKPEHDALTLLPSLSLPLPLRDAERFPLTSSPSHSYVEENRDTETETEPQMLRWPQQAFHTLSTLCQCRLDKESLHAQLLLLLCQSGALELCMETVRLHVDDEETVRSALQCVDLLLSSAQQSAPRRRHIQRLLENYSNVLLLVVFLEKYDGIRAREKEREMKRETEREKERERPKIPLAKKTFFRREAINENNNDNNKAKKKKVKKEAEIFPFVELRILCVSIFVKCVVFSQELTNNSLPPSFRSLSPSLSGCVSPFESLLRKNRPNFVAKAFNEMLRWYSQTLSVRRKECENELSASSLPHGTENEQKDDVLREDLVCAMLHIAELIFLDRRKIFLPHQALSVPLEDKGREDDSHTGEGKEGEEGEDSQCSSRSLRETLSVQVNDYLLIAFCVDALRVYSRQRVLVAQALRTLGNAVCGRDDLRRRANECHAAEEVLRVLRESLSLFRFHVPQSHHFNEETVVAAGRGREKLLSRSASQSISLSRAITPSQSVRGSPSQTTRKAMPPRERSYSSLPPITARTSSPNTARTWRSAFQEEEEANRAEGGDEWAQEDSTFIRSEPQKIVNPRQAAIELIRECFLTLANLFTVIPEEPKIDRDRITGKEIVLFDFVAWDCVRLCVQQGLCEMVMEVFGESQLDPKLRNATLVLLAKMSQKGNTLVCSRLVALGLIEKLGLFLDLNMSMDITQYELVCSLLCNLTQTDPVIIGAATRLVEKTRCEMWAVAHMRRLCRSQGTNGHWSHFVSQAILDLHPTHTGEVFLAAIYNPQGETVITHGPPSSLSQKSYYNNSGSAVILRSAQSESPHAVVSNTNAGKRVCTSCIWSCMLLSQLCTLSHHHGRREIVIDVSRRIRIAGLQHYLHKAPRVIGDVVDPVRLQKKLRLYSLSDTYRVAPFQPLRSQSSPFLQELSQESSLIQSLPEIPTPDMKKKSSRRLREEDVLIDTKALVLAQGEEDIRRAITPLMLENSIDRKPEIDQEKSQDSHRKEQGSVKEQEIFLLPVETTVYAEDSLLADRSVEYARNISKAWFDENIKSLFEAFFVDYGYST